MLLLIAVAATWRNSIFIGRGNLTDILLATSTYFVIACPSALLIIAGGLDFSVGATFSVGAIAATKLMVGGVWWPAAVLLGMVAGGVAGAVGGLITVRFQVPPIISTLAVFYVATGIINVLVPGFVLDLPPGFLQAGQGSLLGLPYLVWYAIIVGLGFWFVLERRPFGYNVRAIGGNRTAALASGVRVERLELYLYALSGAFAGLAGIMYAARTSAGQPDAGGANITLQVLTAVLVGGISLSGGIGSIGGVALGSLLFGVLYSALGISGIDPIWSQVIIGVILAVAVALDGMRRRRRFVDEEPASTQEAVPQPKPANERSERGAEV